MNIGRQTYRFLGLLELLRHYQEDQADKKGVLRKVWLFEFRIHSQPEVVPIEGAVSIMASLLAESRQSNPVESAEREVAPLSHDIGENRSATILLETVRARLFQFKPYDFEHFVKS